MSFKDPVVGHHHKHLNDEQNLGICAVSVMEAGTVCLHSEDSSYIRKLLSWEEVTGKPSK